MNTVIREARSTDVDAIRAAYIESWRAAYESQLERSVLDEQTARREGYDWSAAVAGSTGSQVHVGVVEGRVFGVLEFEPRDNKSPRTPWIQMLYVVPQAWGSGLASALLLLAHERLRSQGHSKAWLEVVETQSRARRFYGRHGWLQEHPHPVRSNGLAGILRYSRCLAEPQ